MPKDLPDPPELTPKLIKQLIEEGRKFAEEVNRTFSGKPSRPIEPEQQELKFLTSQEIIARLNELEKAVKYIQVRLRYLEVRHMTFR